MIGKVVTEPHVENERFGAIEHPRGIEFEFATPTAVILLPEVGNLGSGIGIEHLPTQVHVPPVKE